MSTLGPQPTPEPQSVTPGKTGRGVLVMPGMKLGIQPPTPAIEPMTAGPQAPVLPPVTHAVVPVVVGRGQAPTVTPHGPAPTPSNSSFLAVRPTSGAPRSAVISQTVMPERVGREPSGQLGEIQSIQEPCRRSSNASPFPGAAFPPVAWPVPPRDRAGVAIVGRFEVLPWGEIPEEVCLANALESLGVRVHRVDQYTAQLPVVEPGWVILTADHFSWGRLGDWSRTHQVAVFVREWLLDRRERRAFVEALSRASLLVTADRSDWKGISGVPHVYLPGACDPVEYAFKPKPGRPCAFLGPVTNDRQRAVAAIVRRSKGDVFEKALERPYGHALARFVQETKVTVTDSPKLGAAGFWPAENYAIPGMGGFLVAPDAPGLGGDLSTGVHLATYGSLEELEQVLAFYVERDVEREAIRKAGFEHVRARHTWAQRAGVLVERMGLVRR